MTNAKFMVMIILPALAIFASSCGGGSNRSTNGGSSNSSTLISISISPSSATVETGKTAQFTATVSNTSNVSVAWSATCGTVSTAGLYTAPNQSGNCTVKATSNADSSKSASAAVTVITSLPKTSTLKTSPIKSSKKFDKCENGFSWLRYFSPNLNAGFGEAEGKAVVITADGKIIAGINAVRREEPNPVAALLFYSDDGSELNAIVETKPSRINAMYLDPNTQNIFVAGYFGTDDDPSGHAAMILEVTPNAHEILRSSFHLSGKKTEAYAIAVRDEKIYLGVRSDHQGCGAFGCSNDWIVITDLQGQVLTSIFVGYSMASHHTALTGMLITDDSIWVVGDRFDAQSNIIGSYQQCFSKDDQHSLLFQSTQEDRYGSKIVAHPFNHNLFIGSTNWIGELEKQNFSLEERAANGGKWPSQYSRWNGDNDDEFSVNKLQGLAMNPELDGVTAVGTVSQIGKADPSKTDGGIVSYKKDGSIFWRKRFDSFPSKLSISALNGIVYSNDGKVVFIGTGSDGSICASGSLCNFAVVGKSCYTAPSW